MAVPKKKKSKENKGGTYMMKFFKINTTLLGRKLKLKHLVSIKGFKY